MGNHFIEFCLKRLKKLKPRAKNERGQSIVLVVLLIMSFLVFFGFVINTGVLITAKISLQTAADAAAYAGAAVQARQLNGISLLNYDMREQYKKFLYRYIAIGNFARDGLLQVRGTAPQANGYYSFPIKDLHIPHSDPTKAGWIPMNIPVICLPITPTGTPDDTCIAARKPDVGAILRKQLGSGGVDPLLATTIAQVSAIEDVMTKVCSGRGEVNKTLAYVWLFRGDMDDPSLAAFFDKAITAVNSTSSMDDDARKKIKDLATSITHGLGVFPRNIINLRRIETLKTFLNEEAKLDVENSTTDDFEHAKNAEKHERTIQAFRSAYSNLNKNTFPDGVKMTEIMNPVQLKLRPVQIDFTTYYQDVLAPVAASSTPPTTPPPVASATPSSCEAIIRPIPVNGLPIGVKREGNSFVHYAVKLKAKVRLFLPRSFEVELEAVAGAKPFGSRIGTPDPSEFTYTLAASSIGTIDGKPFVKCDGDYPPCTIPNIKIDSTTTTFSSANFLKEIGLLAGAGGAGFSTAGYKTGMTAAVAPNPREIGAYNIIPAPPTSDTDMDFEFISYWSKSATNGNTNDNSKPLYRFYAPVFPADSADITAEINKFFAIMFPAVSVGASNPLDPSVDLVALGRLIKGQTTTYIKNLESAAKSENSESFTFAAVEFPLLSTASMPSTTGGFWLTKSQEVLSSWAPDNVRTGLSTYNGSGAFKARFGYSVKFVTMRDLLDEGLNDTTGELSKVKH